MWSLAKKSKSPGKKIGPCCFLIEVFSNQNHNKWMESIGKSLSSMGQKMATLKKELALARSPIYGIPEFLHGLSPYPYLLTPP